MNGADGNDVMSGGNRNYNMHGGDGIGQIIGGTGGYFISPVTFEESTKPTEVEM